MGNDRPPRPHGKYVLYWMQMSRRLHDNPALDFALDLAHCWKKPLVVHESLKLNYPWASARHHTFILQGMRDNARRAARLGLAYWPFAATPDEPGHGLVRSMSEEACAVVTDDYPAYIVPAHNRAIGSRCDVAVYLIDGNSIVPLSRLGPPVSAAAHLRPRIHKCFAEAWDQRPAREPAVSAAVASDLEPPFRAWDARQDIVSFVASLPVDRSVPAVPGVEGGTEAGQQALQRFVGSRLSSYAVGRNEPNDPDATAASGLSAYLHYGHISIQEVAEAVLGQGWSTAEINPGAANKRDDFFCRDENVNAFLDEAITWRDIGYHWHYNRNVAVAGKGLKSWQDESTDGGLPRFNFATFDFSPGTTDTLEMVLPAWARKTLGDHRADSREHLYRLDEFEAGETHDPLWNAAQRELVATGRIHNYMRMLWGKKVLEWSKTPDEGYAVLEHLNNKYGLDGRDPNSYTGILWCFGLLDRPWAPERTVFGSVRYMSSANTVKKFEMKGYLDYVARLPSIADVHAGRTMRKPARTTSLFEEV